MPTLKYRPEIDGLRTIAVVPVMLFHLGFTWIGSGYLGVDVFFAISGFLITSIILREINEGQFSFAAFWLRRIRRILPALLAMVAITLVGAHFLAFRLHLPEYGSDGLSAIFSYANFVMRAKGDYWGAKAESSPFLHCWSLSVEEQFYLFYPLFIYGLYKWKVSIKLSLSILMTISLFAFLYTSIYYPRTGFYLLPTRAWELAAGGFLACFSNRKTLTNRNTKSSQLLPVLGLALILFSFFFPFQMRGIGAVTILPVAGALLIMAFTAANEPAGKILGHPIMVFLGKISYPMYLWHWPMIVFAKQLSANGELSILTCVCILLLTLLCGTASYFLLEKPAKKSSNIFKLVLPMAVGCVIICFSYFREWINPYYDSPFEKRAFYAADYFINYKVPANLVDQYATYGIIGGDTSATRLSIIVVGDSHAAMWGKPIDEIAKASGKKVSFFTMKGDNPLESGYQPAIYDLLKNNAPCLLIVCCRWNDRDLTTIQELLHFGAETSNRYLIINQPPLLPAIYEDALTDVPQFFAYKNYLPIPNQPQFLPASKTEEVRKKNRDLFTLVQSCYTCNYLDVYQHFAKGDSVKAMYGNKALYWDDDHLSNQGAEYLEPVLQKAIEENLEKVKNK